MGRKRKFSKILLFAAMLSTIGAGVLGSVPMPVRAAEEGKETYTVRFEAYEGTCETESVTVPKGESIILPDASYEGHYLESWVDVTESENVHTFKAVGTAGSEYMPDRDLWLYANWKPNQEQESEPGQDITATYEARIGDTGYVLSCKLDAPVPCRLDAPDFGFVCHVLADCLHQHQQVI